MNSHASKGTSLNYLKQLKASAEGIVQHCLSTTETLPSAVRIGECASRLQIYSDEAYGTVVNTWYCKHRQCPICQWRKSRRYRSKFHRLLDQNPDLLEGKWIYLTLTVRNCHVSDLGTTLKKMKDAFRRMTNRDFWAHNVLGAVRFTEVKDGGLDPDTAHPHFHCLLLVRPSMFGGVNYVPEQRWSSEWQQALQVAYSPHVKAQRFLSLGGELKEGILKAVSYSTKPQNHVPSRAWLLTMTTEVKDTRQVESFGLLRKLLSELTASGDTDAPDYRGNVRHRQEPLYRSWDNRIQDYQSDSSL